LGSKIGYRPSFRGEFSNASLHASSRRFPDPLVSTTLGAGGTGAGRRRHEVRSAYEEEYRLGPRKRKAETWKGKQKKTGRTFPRRKNAELSECAVLEERFHHRPNSHKRTTT